MKNINFVKAYKKSRFRKDLEVNKLDIFILVLIILSGIGLYRLFFAGGLYSRSDIKRLEEEISYNENILEGLDNSNEELDSEIIREKVFYKGRLDYLLEELPRGVYVTNLSLSNEEETIEGISFNRENIFLYLNRLNDISDRYELFSIDSKNKNFIFNIKTKAGDNYE